LISFYEVIHVKWVRNRLVGLKFYGLPIRELTF
jgi:hypothetical protein